MSKGWYAETCIPYGLYATGGNGRAQGWYFLWLNMYAVKPQAKSAARLADKYLGPRFTRGFLKFLSGDK
jgi:hypothetical protein